MEKKSLSIIGVGAFGELAAKHLAPHFDLILHDPNKDLRAFAESLQARAGSLKEAAACDAIILAVPVQQIKSVLEEISPLLKKDAIVVDVASVKVKPADFMKQILPPTVKIIATHPLFGPQSGKNGIQGLNIALCPIRGNSANALRRFCRKTLGLQVFMTTPEEHDKEMAYVQGLTHLISKVVVSLDLPDFRFKTKTYDLMQQMIGMVRHDSDALFKAIAKENPYSQEAKESFFEAARKLEKRLEES